MISFDRPSAVARAAQMDQLLDFALPPELEAAEPPEIRGAGRDSVRLMVSRVQDDRIIHTQFREIVNYVNAGDVMVINTSGTMPAAIPVTRADGTRLELHLSTHLQGDLWVVEVRSFDGATTKPFYDAISGETLELPAGASVTLNSPHFGQRLNAALLPHRLWKATVHFPSAHGKYLARYGFPIRYSYVKQHWPIEYYQTVYVTEEGSAEMPSAGRPFTTELITRLVARGVLIAPLLLHTGVASLEKNELPYEEFYRVPAETARIVNQARGAGHRVIAVGTTVVRALETVTDEEGVVHAGEGWTDLVVTPRRGLSSINSLLTGLHEPRATHLAMLEALAGRDHLRLAYAQALREKYLWHEFGDSHLIMLR